MAWVLLLFTVVFEVFGTLSMKLSAGLTKWVPTLMIFVSYGLSFSLFSLVLKSIDLSVAYAIWSGAGTLVVSLIGILYFQESLNAVKVISILLIAAGIVGLKFSSGE
jgi:small multidrug resistance pump